MARVVSEEVIKAILDAMNTEGWTVEVRPFAWFADAMADEVDLSEITTDPFAFSEEDKVFYLTLQTFTKLQEYRDEQKQE